MVIYSVH